MKIYKNDLNLLINTISKIKNKKSIMPILDNVFFANNFAFFTNLEYNLKVKFSQQTMNADEKILISFYLLKSIVNLPGTVIEIFDNKIIANGQTFNYNPDNIEDYPELNLFEPVEYQRLEKSVYDLIDFTAKDDISKNPMMSYISVNNGKMVATNSVILGIRKTSIQDEFYIDPKALHVLDKNQPLYICSKDKKSWKKSKIMNICLKQNNIEVFYRIDMSKFKDIKFPNYETVFPTSVPLFEIEFSNSKNIFNLVKNDLQIAEIRNNSMIHKIDVNNNFCPNVKLNNFILKGSDPEPIVFVAKQMHNIIKNYTSPTVNIKYFNATAPMLINDNDLCMPYYLK